MITASLIKKCPHCEIVGEIKNYLSVSTDSRKIVSGQIFIALVGDKFDGSHYAQEVAKKGAGLIVLNDSDTNLNIGKKIWSEFKVPVVLTKDSLLFLQELAAFYREDWKSQNGQRRIIGITGSNGKTTHKEMLFHLLNKLMPNQVLATEGNLNNHIGVPLTLLKITPEHQLAIVEMGMNHPGEISILCKIAGPDCGIITNIGYAHMEFLGGQQEIFNEKRCLFDYVFLRNNPDPFFVICQDDEYLAKLPNLSGVTFFGEKSQDVLLEIVGDIYLFKYNDQEISLNLKSIFGKHNKKNMAACFLLALKIFPEKLDELKRAVASYQAPENNRSQWVYRNNKRYFLDAYNANPGSMMASLEAFLAWVQDEKISPSDCLMVLGDMNELGVHSEEMHKKIGEWMVKSGFKNVLYVGRFSKYYLEGDPKGKSYDTTELLKKDWQDLANSFKFFFLKGSRTVQLESLIENVMISGH